MHKDEKDIPYAVYAKVVGIAAMPKLLDALKRHTPTQLQLLTAWVNEWDPRTEAHVFFILETDGYRMPDEVQRLYGKRYLTGLNAIRNALKMVEGERLMDEVFGAIA
jgi:hypothetical protein